MKKSKSFFIKTRFLAKIPTCFCRLWTSLLAEFERLLILVRMPTDKESVHKIFEGLQLMQRLLVDFWSFMCLRGKKFLRYNWYKENPFGNETPSRCKKWKSVGKSSYLQFEFYQNSLGMIVKTKCAPQVKLFVFLKDNKKF